ncbi:unnamed protein product [marine sediment metagenome]|uniref:Uncharacterized protein n=1 Tax=marine sediment metagenome TaxID=412755 RepID=X1MDR7_9ZZZZ
MPQHGQKGLTVSADLVKAIEEFRDNHPELFFTSNPDVVRFAIRKLVADYEKEHKALSPVLQ